MRSALTTLLSGGLMQPPESEPDLLEWLLFPELLFGVLSLGSLSLASAALSRCLRFLNQLLTCVVVSPVASASSLFSLGDGYGLWAYHSLRMLRDFSLKQ